MGKNDKPQMNLNNLSIDQLSQLRQTVEQDVQSLARGYEALQGAKNRFIESKNCLESMKMYKEGQQVMVPMTHSLYVEGAIADPTSVIVDVGTGYFIKQSVPRAQKFFMNRAAQMQTTMESVGRNIEQKQKAQNNIIDIINEKARTVQAEQPKA